MQLEDCLDVFDAMHPDYGGTFWSTIRVVVMTGGRGWLTDGLYECEMGRQAMYSMRLINLFNDSVLRLHAPKLKVGDIQSFQLKKVMIAHIT